MSNQQTEVPVDAAVVLTVPKRHVKTVKSALEKFGCLDQSVKITPETAEQECKSSDFVTHEHEQGVNAETHDGSVPTSPPDGSATSTSETVPQDLGNVDHFPRLEFDSISGQYVDLAVLRERKEQEESAASSQFTRLEFDSVTGEYVEPAVLETRKQQVAETVSAEVEKVSSATDQFPILQFDSTSGQYIDPSAREESRQPELGAVDSFLVLEFDSLSGQYVDPVVAERRKEQESGIDDERMRISTTLPCLLGTNAASDASDDHELKSKILEDLGLSHLFQEIMLSHREILPRENHATKLKNPLHRALQEALDALPEATLSSLELTTGSLVSSFPEAYSVYKPLLLLPHISFSSPSWAKLLSSHSSDSDLLQPVWQRIVTAVGATHVAINSPIPLHTSNEQFSSADTHLNILRSPTDLRPICGDFGPSPTPQTLSFPTSSDFASAFWVTTIQNGIQQTWAPRYTMFSRGNIREKTRILNLPSVTTCPEAPYTAADFYAGIGYFAFSYKKGGQQDIGKVLCWELNPWSVEGLRRGAELNGWTCRVFTHRPGTDLEWDRFRKDSETWKNTDFCVFQTSNEHVHDHVRWLARHERPPIPPIRHINLGLLPASTLSWPAAVRLIDAEKGGWIRVHENVGAKDIVPRTMEIASEFQSLMGKEDNEGVLGPRRVVVEHVEKVKTYAPGVVHVVFDVRVEGRAMGRW